jgi:hypothetical protein
LGLQRKSEGFRLNPGLGMAGLAAQRRNYERSAAACAGVKGVLRITSGKG